MPQTQVLPSFSVLFKIPLQEVNTNQPQPPSQRGHLCSVMSLSAPSRSKPREQRILPGQCLRSLVPSVPRKAQVCRVPGQTLTDASSESGRSPGFPQPHLTRRGWHAGHSGWVLPFLLLTHRYALRRYAETSPRATSRKRQAERKNTKLFGSASRDPAGRRKDFPSR